MTHKEKPLMGKPNLTAVAVAATCTILAVPVGAMAGGYVITSTKQIKPSVRRALHGARGTRGPQGQAGPQGLPGPQGAPGLAGVEVVESPSVTAPAGSYVTVTANCPAGKTAIGTGFYGDLPGFVKSYGTFVGGFFYGGDYGDDVHVQAICAYTNAGATARTIKPSQFEADTARARAQTAR